MIYSGKQRVHRPRTTPTRVWRPTSTTTTTTDASGTKQSSAALDRLFASPCSLRMHAKHRALEARKAALSFARFLRVGMQTRNCSPKELIPSATLDGHYNSAPFSLLISVLTFSLYISVHYQNCPNNDCIRSFSFIETWSVLLYSNLDSVK